MDTNRENDEQKIISKESNIELYEILLIKHSKEIYRNKPNSLGDKLGIKQQAFVNLTLREQINVLLEILKATQYQNLKVEAKELDLKMSPNKISNDVSGQDEFLLINQSVTGIYTSVIDLKTV